MKYFIIFLIMFSCLNSAAEIVARVGEYAITSEQVENKLADFEGDYDLPLFELKKLALDKLIEEQLLFIYAKSHGITVSQNEVETYFISVLGDDPKLMTNGRFDYRKFQKLKSTPEVKNILKDMKRDILINKTRSLIEESFDLSDEKLMKHFILENARIDISYALINTDDVAVSTAFTPENARRFFLSHRNLFLTPKRVKLRFFIVPFADFSKTACDSITPQIEKMALADSLRSQTYYDSLRFKLIKEATIRLTEKKAENQKRLAEKNLPISYPILETPFLAEGDSLGKIPPEIIKSAFYMEKLQYSEPLEIERGFLVFQLKETESPTFQKLEDIPQKVWREYVKYQKSSPANKEKEDFYYSHLSDFITKAALVWKIKIPLSKSPFLKTATKKENQKNILDLIRINRDNHEEMEKICREYKLQHSKKIIFLEKFANAEKLDDLIAEKINKKLYSGFVDYDDSVVFYRLETFFPEYIPEFSEVSYYLSDHSVNSKIDTTGFYDYFEKHKRSFQHPDSLQLGICYIPAEPDSVSISDYEVKRYYKKNLKKFERGQSVKIDYVFSKDKEFVWKLYDYATSGVAFWLLNYCFNEEDKFSRNEILETDKFPEEIKKVLGQISVGEVSAPVKFENGWIIIKKLKELPSGLMDFSEASSVIISQLRQKKADSLAYARAKAVFDSTQYFSQCLRFVKNENIIKTAFQEADKKFEILGDISEYKKELLRMWKNEKFSRVVKTKNGYAVVFMLRKKPAKPMNYAEALPMIENKIKAQRKQKTAMIFVKNLRSKIIGGADPDSVLFFFGGWKKAENLNLDSKIPGIPFSSQFLEDVSKREEGYFSPVIKISEDSFLFYHIDKMTKISTEDYLREKEEFKQKIMKKLFADWLEKQKAKVSIQIF